MQSFDPSRTFYPFSYGDPYLGPASAVTQARLEVVVATLLREWDSLAARDTPDPTHPRDRHEHPCARAIRLSEPNRQGGTNLTGDMDQK